MNKDLSTGNAGKVLIRFTIPLFISVVFQQLYSIADSVIAGKFAGEDALAAIGASYPVTMIFMAVAIGCQIGCSVVISRNFGTGNVGKTKTCISTSLIAGTVLAVVLTLVGVLFSRQLMEIVNTPSNIFNEGNLYLKIYNGGFIFLFLYNIATGIFNSLGDSKTPLYLLIGSSLGNIGLDALFVIVFNLGVAGVAWATFIAQSIACIISLVILFSRIRKMCRANNCSNADLFSFAELKEILAVAVPSILQQSFISIGNLFIQCMVNGYGSSVIAGYSAAIKLNTFAVTTFTTLGNGVSSFTAQNIGAGKTERVREAFRSGIAFALSVSTVFFILFFFFGNSFIVLFMNENSTPLAIETGVKFLKIVSPFYFSVCSKLICDGVLRGSESMGYFMIATFTDLILRVVLAFVLSHFFSQTGIWMAWPVSWIIAATMSVLFYANNVWTNKSVKKCCVDELANVE